MSLQLLDGKVALVGAGAKNLGGLISRDLAKHGANIVVHCHGEGTRGAGGKAQVEDFTRAAAKEFGPRGISVTAVGPGPMDTPFFYGQETPERVAYHKSQSMNGELAKIEDIAPIVRFLAAEGWWITGQTIFANGGYTTR